MRTTRRASKASFAALVLAVATPIGWGCSEAGTPRNLTTSLPRVTGLPAPCSLSTARRRILRAFNAFNSRQPTQFGANFSTRATFQPYSMKRPLQGRVAITHFLEKRLSRPDRWRMRRLIPPYFQPRPDRAVYLALLTVYSDRRNARASGAANVDISCASNLILSWSGPARSVG